MKVWILEIWDGEEWLMEGIFKTQESPLQLVEDMQLEEDDYMLYEQELLD